MQISLLFTGTSFVCKCLLALFAEHLCSGVERMVKSIKIGERGKIS
jgi:hypothetical protein